MPFAEFCRARIFEPLGMTHTSWRDDFRRIVKGRAIAYDEAKDGYRQNMPFENVYGNGGLLTTVGDLLRWNENAVDQKVGDAEFLRVELQPGQFNNGTPHDYAMGLYIQTVHGRARGRATAGRPPATAPTSTRYPRAAPVGGRALQRVERNAERYAHAVAALYLAGAINAHRGMMEPGPR